MRLDTERIQRIVDELRNPQADEQERSNMAAFLTREFLPTPKSVNAPSTIRYDSGFQGGPSAMTPEEKCERYESVLRIIATPKRADGTYNRDRFSCQLLAESVLSDCDYERGCINCHSVWRNASRMPLHARSVSSGARIMMSRISGFPYRPKPKWMRGHLEDIEVQTMAGCLTEIRAQNACLIQRVAKLERDLAYLDKHFGCDEVIP